jgi:hypothetical protein
MPVQRCQVGYVDTGRVRHTVLVDAETVYEAAIRGLAALRHHPWCGPQVSQRGCILDVVPEGTSRVYRVTVDRLLKWLDSAGGRRGEFVQRYQLKRLLMADAFPNPRVNARVRSH